jgi:hypothetical protein
MLCCIVAWTHEWWWHMFMFLVMTLLFEIAGSEISHTRGTRSVPGNCCTLPSKTYYVQRRQQLYHLFKQELFNYAEANNGGRWTEFCGVGLLMAGSIVRNLIFEECRWWVKDLRYVLRYEARVNVSSWSMLVKKVRKCYYVFLENPGFYMDNVLAKVCRNMVLCSWLVFQAGVLSSSISNHTNVY